MQTLISRATAAALLLAPVFVGCAALQEGAPQDTPPDGPTRSFDYIDDRVPDEQEVDETALIDATGDLDEPEVDELVVEETEPEEVEPRAPIRQLSLQAGIRDFTDETIFGRVDSEAAFGIEYAHEVRDGLGFEVGGIGSLSTENGLSGNPDITGAAAEIYGGARYWLRGERRWTPYVGAGLAAIMAGVDDDAGGQVSDDQDFSLGFYAHGGIQYNVNEFLFLGADVRGLFGTDLDLTTVSGDADYLQFMLVLGFRL